MTLTLSDDLLRSTRLTLGKAAPFAALPQLDFQRLLASRNIPLHYGMEEMEQDIDRAK